MRSKKQRDGMRKSILAIIIFSALALVMFSVPFSHAAATAQLQHNEVILSWDSVANATQYKIYQSTDNSTWTLLNSTNATTYTTAKLTNSGTYYYKIEALNSTGAVLSTQYTNVKFYPPAKPAGLTAVISGGEVKLSWNAVTGATGYYVYRGTSAGNETLLGSALNNSYTDSNIKAGTTYYYYVIAYNSTGESAASAEIQVTPTSGGGTVIIGPTQWNTYLLAVGFLLLYVGAPLYIWGGESHKDVAKYAVVGGSIFVLVSFIAGYMGYKPEMLTIYGVALNQIFVVIGAIFFVAGIVMLLFAKNRHFESHKMRKEMEQHVDVAVFSIGFGVIAFVLSWLWALIA